MGIKRSLSIPDHGPLNRIGENSSKSCPNCGSTIATERRPNGSFRALCRGCGSVNGAGATKSEAISDLIAHTRVY